MSGISQRINDNASLTEKALEGYLSGSGRTYEVLAEAMRYSALAGGKRVRPTLVIEFSRLFGGTDEKALPYACAIEMIHTYSLIHDDLPCMDGDDMRRGKPTCHKAFGEATALLAGDALLTRAFGIAASNRFTSAEQNARAVALLSEKAGIDGMCGGQTVDLEGEKRRLTYDELTEMNLLKTGALIRASALIGCIAAGVTEGEQKAKDADTYAKNIGLAFQIVDDLLDEGTEENKTTFLTFMTAKEAGELAEQLTEKAVKAIEGYDGSGFLVEFARELTKRKI